MQTILKLLGGYSQIIGRIYLPIPPHSGFGTPVGEKMKQRQTKVEETDLLETIIREKHKTKPSDTSSVYAVSLWYWYKPKARQQSLLHMRLYFRVKELVQYSLFVNRS